LEASFSQTKVLPRKNSIEMKDIFRHAQASDLEAKDLDFNFSLDRSNYPLGNLQSLQDVFPAVQHDTHLRNPRNFSDETVIDRLLILQSMAYARLSRIDSTPSCRSTCSTRPTELMGRLEYSKTFAHECTLWTFKTFEATCILRTSHTREAHFVCESDIIDPRQHDGPFQVLER
jgi:hypothetical protein